MDVNELVAGMGDLISRTQGEMIRYEFSLGAQPPFCVCDANQLETALLNPVINARDAMPQGGRLTIATANVAFDEVRAQPPPHCRGLLRDARSQRYRGRHVA